MHDGLSRGRRIARGIENNSSGSYPDRQKYQARKYGRGTQTRARACKDGSTFIGASVVSADEMLRWHPDDRARCIGRRADAARGG